MQFGNLTLKQCKYGWMLFSGPYIGKCFELYGQYSESAGHEKPGPRSARIAAAIRSVSRGINYLS
jgi:hypothetical protein